MSDSICRFIPAKNLTGGIKTVHFVYESDFHSLKQPFLRPIYYAHLVTGGSALMELYGKEYALEKGTLFFILPAHPITITGSEDFKYMYISFMGSSVPSLLEELNVRTDSLVFGGFEHLVDFWMHEILRLNEGNANLLSEGVLLYTLSFLSPVGNSKKETDPDSVFQMLVDYIDSNYRDPELSLKKLASIFSYTEKYVSHLFKKNMNVGFNLYLNNLRLRYATELVSSGVTSVSEIAIRCGYRDPLYFSRLFKKRTGYAPTEYHKRNG
ncbi:MAG: helix-turn-helix domain-containing protein [Ruminococcaceae bacterium]|nr:helix-turn-helix domain-containing protein [Oscillospiraceae bacterium]